LYAALAFENILENAGTTGRSNRRVPVSVEMVAETITRYFIHGTETGYMPTPNEFRDACLASRYRVECLRSKVRTLMNETIPELLIEHKQSLLIEHERSPAQIEYEVAACMRQLRDGEVISEEVPKDVIEEACRRLNDWPPFDDDVPS
jgi:hypothetical protein